MMEKEQSIIKFIERLKSQVDFNQLEIVDYWEADLCAIGVKRGQKLFYISTYNYINAKTIQYDYDIEKVDDQDQAYTKVIKEGRGVSELKLIEEIKIFLEV
jgi:hypothetical protein